MATVLQDLNTCRMQEHECHQTLMITQGLHIVHLVEVRRPVLIITIIVEATIAGRRQVLGITADLILHIQEAVIPEGAVLEAHLPGLVPGVLPVHQVPVDQVFQEAGEVVNGKFYKILLKV